MKITIVSAKSKQTTKLDCDSIFLNPKNGREKSFFGHICTFALKKENLASEEYLEINFEPLSADFCSKTYDLDSGSYDDDDDDHNDDDIEETKLTTQQ